MKVITETEILNRLKRYFEIHELVGKQTYLKYKESAWRFFSFRLLHTLLILRENINKPITINNWYWGGKFSQRGLRTNVQEIFRSYFIKFRLYLSAHVLGEAIDFDIEGMTADQVREWIINNAHLFPYKIRLEAGVNWVHLDVIYEEKNPKIYIFKP